MEATDSPPALPRPSTTLPGRPPPALVIPRTGQVGAAAWFGPIRQGGGDGRLCGTAYFGRGEFVLFAGDEMGELVGGVCAGGSRSGLLRLQHLMVVTPPTT